ncbi:MAG: response regulator [Planctomycetota bacterium]|jgi:CheY-like chemotaxis protein
MKQILLVHDAQENYLSRVEYLESKGYAVTLSTSSVEALRICESHKPDLVITDVLIEGQHGFDLVTALRARFKPEDLPMLICSGIYRGRAYNEEAFTRGAQAYLRWPAALDDLGREVELLFEDASASEGEENLDQAA